MQFDAKRLKDISNWGVVKQYSELTKDLNTSIVELLLSYDQRISPSGRKMEPRKLPEFEKVFRQWNEEYGVPRFVNEL